MNTSPSSAEARGEQRLFSQLSFPEIFEQELVGPLFRPWADSLLDDVTLTPADRLLDIACGTGIVARVARERQGPDATIVGIDLNPQMIAIARRVAPAIDWREGDAGSLPLRNGEKFDVVVCQQGFQFFPDRAAAARQMHAALVPNGRLGVSTWRPDEEFPVLRELRRIAERHVGPVADRRHSLGDPGPVEAVLRESGFQNVRSRHFSRTTRFEDGNVFARLNAMALVGMSAQASTLDDGARKRFIDVIAADSADLVHSHSDAAGFTFEIGTNVILATA